MTGLLLATAILAFYLGVRVIRSTGALPIWRFGRSVGSASMRSVPSLADEAERARILATPMEELAEEIVRERELAELGAALPLEIAADIVKREVDAAAKQWGRAPVSPLVARYLVISGGRLDYVKQVVVFRDGYEIPIETVERTNG